MVKEIHWILAVLFVLAFAAPSWGQGTTTLTDEDMNCILQRLQKDHQWLTGDFHPTTSTVDIQIYGYVKLDAVWDNAKVAEGNTAYWVYRTDSTNRMDDEFNMTARQTRLGLKLKGPNFGDATTFAQVEIDFYGGGTENKNTPMMRHAYRFSSQRLHPQF